MVKFVESFLCSNGVAARLMRGLLQGFIGVVVAVLTMDNLVEMINEVLYNIGIEGAGAALIVVAVTGILSPIMAELGKWAEK